MLCQPQAALLACLRSLLTFYEGAFAILDSHLALYTIEAALRLLVRR